MKHLAAGLLLFCWLPLWGQVTNLHFTNLSIDAGLSDKMVFAVAQDSTGLMWFGTAEGLNRYDGYNFETFRYNPGDSTSVSASFINCIHLTRTGELWIGTEKGLDLYDPGKFREIPCGQRLAAAAQQPAHPLHPRRSARGDVGRDARRADPPRPAETLYQLFRTGTRRIRPDGQRNPQHLRRPARDVVARHLRRTLPLQPHGQQFRPL